MLGMGIKQYTSLFYSVQAMGMPQEAILCYQRALHARPDYSIAYGKCLHVIDVSFKDGREVK